MHLEICHTSCPLANAELCLGKKWHEFAVRLASLCRWMGEGISNLVFALEQVPTLLV